MKRTPLWHLPLLALAGCVQQAPSTAGDTASLNNTSSAQTTKDMDNDARDEQLTINMVSALNGDIDCDGHDLNIVGPDADLVLRGHCNKVTLFGRNDSLQIEQADALRVLGDNAQVTMHGDAKRVMLLGRIGNLQMQHIATLEVFGDENQLHATVIDKIALHGNHNQIVQDSGTAVIDNDGSDNRIAGQ
ncbi:DUF3060 domain-containing protein [Xanthomonas sp. MUS 060]|uniref:DUF3060 domain-containing protein n=1 Tax=Xanthomonas sp. MUS 060 TaxID=1588031 RepID=UPI000698EE9A|nr:DUF3060 domain-containing protein [Xanthomonas sp. MUS 060]